MDQLQGHSRGLVQAPELRVRGPLTVSVLDGYGVQYAIVLDQPEQTILLFNQEHRGCYGKFGRLDSSGTQVFLQEGVQSSLF